MKRPITIHVDDSHIQAKLDELRALQAQCGFTAHSTETILGDALDAGLSQRIDELRHVAEAIAPTPVQRFAHDLREGRLGLPYCPALPEHLFRAFLTWHRRTDESQAPNLNRFVPEFMTHTGTRRARMLLPVVRRTPEGYIASPDRQHRQVLLLGTPGAAQDSAAWVHQGVLSFAQATDAYCTDPATATSATGRPQIMSDWCGALDARQAS